MAKDDFKFCIFPVSLIRDAFTNVQLTVDRIFDYAVFKHTDKLEHGDELEKMKAAAHLFNIRFGHIESALENAKKLGNEFDLKTPQVMIGIDILWDFYKNRKTEFNIACFCAFCAIKSILGAKPFAKTNKRLVVARMFGKSGGNEVVAEYPDTFLYLSDVANYLGKRYSGHVSVGSLSNAIKKGYLRANKPSKNSFLIDRSDLDKWYADNYSQSKSISRLNIKLRC